MKLNDVLKWFAPFLVMTCALPACGLQLKPQYAVFKCKAKVLEPYVGDLADSVITQVSGDKFNLTELLVSIGVPLMEIDQVKSDLKKCGVVPVVQQDGGVPKQ